MEEMDVGYGFAMYRAHTPVKAGKLFCPAIGDRANIMVDRKRYWIEEFHGEFPVDIPEGVLEIFVENHGRANNAFDHLKGLSATPTLNGTHIKGWSSIGFDTNRVQKLPWKSEIPEDVPGFYRATFTVNEIGDTFLNPKGWTRGFAWINGFNIGRYWTIGPQLTLYVPAGLLKLGENEVIILELEHRGKITGIMSLDDFHELDINK
jgi:beta-galactosidase